LPNQRRGRNQHLSRNQHHSPRSIALQPDAQRRRGAGSGDRAGLADQAGGLVIRG